MTNLLRTVMNPALEASIAQTRAAVEDARRAALASAKTNFDVLLVQGVICTPDDEEDRARRWSLVSDLAVALGATHKEVEAGMDLVDAERGELRQLLSIAANGESRREYLARVDSVMSTLPKGTTERGRCTHKGRMGWKFRGVGLVDGDRLYCRVCGASVVLPARAPGLSPDAQAAIKILADAATWYAANGEEALAAYAAGGKNDWYEARNAVRERGIALRRQAASAASRP